MTAKCQKKNKNATSQTQNPTNFPYRQRAIFLESICHERGMLKLGHTSRLDEHARLLQANWLRCFQLFFLNLFRTRLRYARRDSPGCAPGFGGRGGTNSPMDRIRSKWGRRSSGSVDPSVSEREELSCCRRRHTCRSRWICSSNTWLCWVLRSLPSMSCWTRSVNLSEFLCFDFKRAHRFMDGGCINR